MGSNTAIILLLALAAGPAWATPSNCDALGFTGLASCSDCELFSEFVHDPELLTDCKACCVKDAASVRYHKAVLELCPYKKSGLPQVTDFIKKHLKPEFAGRVTVRENIGAYPRLVLSEPEGSSKGSGGKGGGSSSGGAPSKTAVRIDNWKAATIAEFLRDKLAAAPAEGSGAKPAAT